MKLFKTFCNIGKRAKNVLLVGLPIIVIELCFVLVMLLGADTKETVALIHTFPLIMENILLSLVLTVGGAILLDFCEKEAGEG